MTSEPLPHAAAAMAKNIVSDLLLGRFDFGLVHPFPSRARSESVAVDPASDVEKWLRVSASSVTESKRLLAQARAVATGVVDGVVLGKREIFAEKLARLAGETFAMEAMARYAAAVAPPSAVLLTKVWASERACEHAELVTQIELAAGRGNGRGAPLEVTGSNDELRLGVARAVIARHWEAIAPMLDAQRSGKERFEASQAAAWNYVRWYPRQWLGPLADFGLLFSDLSPRLAAHVRWSARASHRLARALFHALVLHGARLEHEELLLARIVDLATEIIAVCTACSYAQHLHTPESLELADYFARVTRVKIARLFHGLDHHADRAAERLGRSVLAGRQAWLELD